MAYSVSHGPRQGSSNPSAAGATKDQKNSRNMKGAEKAKEPRPSHSPMAAKSRKKSKKPY